MKRIVSITDFPCLRNGKNILCHYICIGIDTQKLSNIGIVHKVLEDISTLERFLSFHLVHFVE